MAPSDLDRVPPPAAPSARSDSLLGDSLHPAFVCPRALCGQAVVPQWKTRRAACVILPVTRNSGMRFADSPAELSGWLETVLRLSAPPQACAGSLRFATTMGGRKKAKFPALFAESGDSHTVRGPRQGPCKQSPCRTSLRNRVLLLSVQVADRVSCSSCRSKHIPGLPLAELSTRLATSLRLSWAASERQHCLCTPVSFFSFSVH